MSEHSNEIAWISNLPLRSFGGGTYAVNYHCSRSLSDCFRIDYRDPIEIRADPVVAWTSRIRRRLLQQPGRFPVFAKRRLEANAKRIGKSLRPEHSPAFFKGITPWSAWQPDRPFFCYTDIAFHTFFHNTFDPSDFIEDDIQRILDAERSFLETADAVFFESQWGLEETCRAYNLTGENFIYAGRGGNLPIPEADVWDGKSLALVTMAKHFRQKGGDLVLEAYRSLKRDYPGLTWHILGGEPDFDWRATEGVLYEGFLNPDHPQDLERMQAILGNTFLLLHPTREDTNPLVITEAACFGCPAISVRKFAIPELIQDGETGILVEAPATPEALSRAVRELLDNPERYREMRHRARDFAITHFTWDQVAERMASRIREILDGTTG